MLGRLLGLSLLLLAVPAHADDLAPLKVALEKQVLYKSLSVDVRQTKKVPALTEETVLLGHLWLQPGKTFRWQLGKPLVQSAIYDGTKVYLLDETLKTAMELLPDDRRAKPIMLMLGIGEESTAEGMKDAFNVKSTNLVGEQFVASLIPKGGLKRALSSMVIQINTRTSFVERIEWTQRDGTVVITEFSAPVINQPIPKGILEVKRDGYKWE